MDRTLHLLHNEPSLVQQATLEPQAFADIYDHYFPRVYTYIRYRVEDDDTADDLTALVFERALRQIHKYDANRAPFAAWLFGIARNTVGNDHRHKRRWQWFSLEQVKEEPPMPEPLPEETLISGENHERLLKAVRRLNEREQDLIALKFVSGMTNRDIAKMVKLTESNVSVILYRSLQKLRTLLEENADEHSI